MPTSEKLFATRWLSLERIGTWDFVRRPHSDACVGILAITPYDEVVLIEQFRIPTQRHVIEIPAGIVGDEKEHHGESLADTAARELLEETGYRAAQWAFLTTIHPAIGFADERLDIFLCRELEHVGRQLDDGEFLEIDIVTLGWLMDELRAGRLTDVKTQIAVHWLERIVEGRWAWPSFDLT